MIGTNKHLPTVSGFFRKHLTRAIPYRKCFFIVLLLLLGLGHPTQGSNRATGKRVFPRMDHALTVMPDGRTRVVFHINHFSASPGTCIPFLGFTIDSTESWYKVVAWYDMRDSRPSEMPCERYDTVYYSGHHVDSVRLVAATIYRDSMEYSFSRNDWNLADSFYFFQRPDDMLAPPQSNHFRIRTNGAKGEALVENPFHIPLTGVEILTEKGALVRTLKPPVRTFSLRGLNAGFYLARIKSAFGNQVEILIVSR